MRIFLALLIFFPYGSALSEADTPGLIIKELQNDIYLHISFSRVEGWGLVSSNGLIVVDGVKAYIIDTPWSDRDTENLVKWIKENNYELLGSISTHSHEDRTAGIKWLNDNSIQTYASALTNQLLNANGKELAEKTFDGTDFSLGDGLIEAFYPGGGHTIDNIVVWLPKSKILFGGCFVRSLASRSLGYTGEAYIDKWASSVDKVLSKFPDANLVVPGHGKIGNTKLLKHTKELAELASNKSIQSTAKASAD